MGLTEEVEKLKALPSPESHPSENLSVPQLRFFRSLKLARTCSSRTFDDLGMGLSLLGELRTFAMACWNHLSNLLCRYRLPIIRVQLQQGCIAVEFLPLFLLWGH